MTARQDALDDLIDRRAAQWELRGCKAIGSFDDSGILKGDGSGDWVQESTPRLDWWPLILLARRYVELPP